MPQLIRAVLSFNTMTIYAQYDDNSLTIYDVLSAPLEVLEMAADSYNEYVKMGGVHN